MHFKFNPRIALVKSAFPASNKQLLVGYLSMIRLERPDKISLSVVFNALIMDATRKLEFLFS
jgi:hypothetical protein